MKDDISDRRPLGAQADVDRIEVRLEQLPPRRGADVAERAGRTCVQECAAELPFLPYGAVPERVHVWVQAMKPLRRLPPRDRTAAETDGEKLCATQDAALGLGDRNHSFCPAIYPETGSIPGQFAHVG